LFIMPKTRYKGVIDIYDCCVIFFHITIVQDDGLICKLSTSYPQINLTDYIIG
jgi:hypothetical protein